MKKILLLSFGLLVLPVFAEDDKKKMSPAEELVEVMEFEQNIIEGGEAAFSMVEENLSAEDLNEEEMQEVKDAFLVYMAKLANDPALKPKTIELYEKNFTKEELADLVVFYKTPLGKKTLSKLPAITGEIAVLSQKLAQNHVGAFQDALSDILERKNERLKAAE